MLVRYILCPICIQQTRGGTYYVILRNNLRLHFPGFLIASWRLLDVLLALLDDSWKLLADSWQLFPLSNRQVYSRYTKEPLRHRQEADETQTRITRYRQEVTRYIKMSRFLLLKFSKFFLELPDLSRIIKNYQEVSRSCSRQEVSKKLLRSVKTLRSALFLFNFVKVGQLEFHQIIITN